MMNNLNLRKRILLGYLAPLLLMVLVSIVVIWSTQRLNELSNGVELAHAIVSNIKDVHSDSLELQTSVRGYILPKNETSGKTYSDQIPLVREKLAALSSQIKDPKQAANLREIGATVERLIEFTEKEVQLVDAGEVAKAVQTYGIGTGRELGSTLTKMVDAFDQRETEILMARQAEESRAMESLVTLVLTLTAVTVALALVLGWWIASRISHALIE